MTFTVLTFTRRADASSPLDYTGVLKAKVIWSMPFRKLSNANIYDIGDFTTPLPSSSPGPSSDSMDIIPSSPLPHKPAFGATFQIQLQSPTPELTPADSSDLSIPSPPLETLLEPPKLSLPQECVLQDTSTHITLLTWWTDERSLVHFGLDLLGPKAIPQAVCHRNPSLKAGCLPSNLAVDYLSSARLLR